MLNQDSELTGNKHRRDLSFFAAVLQIAKFPAVPHRKLHGFCNPQNLIFLLSNSSESGGFGPLPAQEKTDDDRSDRFFAIIFIVEWRAWRSHPDFYRSEVAWQVKNKARKGRRGSVFCQFSSGAVQADPFFGLKRFSSWVKVVLVVFSENIIYSLMA